MSEIRKYHSINIFRYVCAILVLAIHTRPFIEYNPGFAFLFDEVISRIAVPFFFVASGYFISTAIAHGRDGNRLIFKQIKIYFLWSIVFLIYTFSCDVKNGNIIGAIKDVAFSFFVTGSTEIYWFFPALIYSMIVLCILNRVLKLRGRRITYVVSIFLYIIGCFGASYYSIGIQIPILSTLYTWQYFTVFRRIALMGFPFVCLGSSLASPQRWNLKWASICYLVLIAIVFFLEMFAIYYYGLQNGNMITFALYPLVMLLFFYLLKHPANNLQLAGEFSKRLATLTYLFQPVCLLVIRIFGPNISNTVQFFGILCFIFILQLIIDKVKGIFNGKRT